MYAMIFLQPIPEINTLDAILEAAALIGYLFILIMLIYAKNRNKIFASKGFPVMILAIILGVISSFMDLFTEFYWIDQNYELYKLIMSIFQILCLLVFAISLLIVFKFTNFMLGNDKTE